MRLANRFALKEWAVVCCALREGRQTILLRSGGIAEGRDGFAVQHDEFWLFATRFHQSADELTPNAAPLFEAAADSQPPDGTVRLPLYATLEKSYHIMDPGRLVRLADWHILEHETVLNRFHYRQPGLSVLMVRCYVPPASIDIPDSPYFAGCHSWVDLSSEISTDDLRPVFDEETFQSRAEMLDRLLSVQM